MSTRSIVGAITPNGALGVYCHSDGYPDHQLVVLRALVDRDGAEAAARNLLEHAKEGGGWSYLSTEKDGTNALGADRAEYIPGYGLAYRDAPGPTHQSTLDEALKYSAIEYIYFIDPHTGNIHWYDGNDPRVYIDYAPAPLEPIIEPEPETPELDQKSAQFDIDPTLALMLEGAGREWGPLGVAIAAARLTDVDALIQVLQAEQTQPKPDPESLELTTSE